MIFSVKNIQHFWYFGKCSDILGRRLCVQDVMWPAAAARLHLPRWPCSSRKL